MSSDRRGTIRTRLWPVYPSLGGEAFLALFLADRAHNVGVLGVVCGVMIVGVAGLAITSRVLSGEIVILWPLLLVLMGLNGLVGTGVQALWRR